MVTPRLPRVRGLGRCLAAVAVIITVWMTTMGAGRINVYTKPDALPALSVSTLAARYEANRRSIERALRTAERIHDADRTQALSGLLAPGRDFLSFDPRGTGRAVEVVGDLARARRGAILGPGGDTTLSPFDSRGRPPHAAPRGGGGAPPPPATRG